MLQDPLTGFRKCGAHRCHLVSPDPEHADLRRLDEPCLEAPLRAAFRPRRRLLDRGLLGSLHLKTTEWVGGLGPCSPSGSTLPAVSSGVNPAHIEVGCRPQRPREASGLLGAPHGPRGARLPQGAAEGWQSSGSRWHPQGPRPGHRHVLPSHPVPVRSTPPASFLLEATARLALGTRCPPFPRRDPKAKGERRVSRALLVLLDPLDPRALLETTVPKAAP